jgi:hypothetical protein
MTLKVHQNLDMQTCRTQREAAKKIIAMEMHFTLVNRVSQILIQVSLVTS